MGRPQILKVEKSKEEKCIAAGLRVLKEERPIAYPTETVYDLGVVYGSHRGAEQLRNLKGDESPFFAIHIAEHRQLDQFVSTLPRNVERTISTYWPGPLTIVCATKGGEKLGFRLPSHPVAQGLVQQAGPLLATSAAPHSEPECITAQDVARHYVGRLDLILDGGTTPLGQPSTVVEFEQNRWKILREGFITRSMLQRVAGFTLLFVCTGNTCRSPMAEALCRNMLAQRLGISVEELEEWGFHVASAGVLASPSPITPHANQVLKECNLDMSHHRARRVTPQMLEEADYVFVMTQSHYDLLGHHYPLYMHKIALLRQGGIEDPIGGNLEEYRRCAHIIESSLRRILDRLLPPDQGEKMEKSQEKREEPKS